jgi:hypothetical protein
MLGATPATDTKPEKEEARPGVADTDALLSEMGWTASDHAPAKCVIAETRSVMNQV